MKATNILTLALCCTALATHAAALDRIQPYAKNPFYWQYQGKPVLLLGGSDDDNLFQWERPKLEAKLDLLVSVGGNYIRNTMSDRDAGNLYAFARVGDRYDLNVWNEEYWQRLKTFLRLAATRDVIVQIELWDMWDLTRDNWARHPFNPPNNVNYSAAESGLLTEVPFAPAEEPTKHNFFHTVPALENNTRVLRYQEAFIDRVLEILLPFPNVLYCINNESGEPPEWSRYWAQRIHQRAKERGVSAQVTDMRRREDITHATHRTAYDDTEVYTFADVSQNTGGQIRDSRLQYRRLLEVRKYLGEAPRPINNVKIYNDNFGGAPKFLRNVFAGLASTRFHRPVGGTRGLGLSGEAQRILRSVRTFTDALDWFAMQPRPDLLSHDNGVYLMARPGRHYALGFDGGGSVELDARALSGTAQLQWMSLHAGKWIDGGQVKPGRLSLKTPGDGLWMALIQARKHCDLAMKQLIALGVSLRYLATTAVAEVGDFSIPAVNPLNVAQLEALRELVMCRQSAGNAFILKSIFLTATQVPQDQRCNTKRTLDPVGDDHVRT